MPVAITYLLLIGVCCLIDEGPTKILPSLFFFWSYAHLAYTILPFFFLGISRSVAWQRLSQRPCWHKAKGGRPLAKSVWLPSLPTWSLASWSYPLFMLPTNTWQAKDQWRQWASRGISPQLCNWFCCCIIQLDSFGCCSPVVNGLMEHG